jgi:5'-3' exonuclease
MKISLIDGDIVAYRCAASVMATKSKEREPDELAILRLDELMYRILNDTQSSEYKLYISGSENFRKILYPAYKANRTQPIPHMLGPCQEFLFNEWKAKFTEGYEADDAIGMEHDPDITIVCSIDKDLKQLPGEHYNFVKIEWDVIDEETAERNFWTQMLVGDTSDNIRGVDGIGPVKAKRILDGNHDMYGTVRDIYNDDERFLMNFRLLRILRNPVEYEHILKEIENKNSLSESEGESPSEDSGGEATGVVSESNLE